MKCPHCDYQHGYSVEENSDIKSEHGKFYQLSNLVKMERPDTYEKQLNLYGCPSCKKVFMGY